MSCIWASGAAWRYRQAHCPKRSHTWRWGVLPSAGGGRCPNPHVLDIFGYSRLPAGPPAMPRSDSQSSEAEEVMAADPPVFRGCGRDTRDFPDQFVMLAEDGHESMVFNNLLEDQQELVGVEPLFEKGGSGWCWPSHAIARPSCGRVLPPADANSFQLARQGARSYRMCGEFAYCL